MNDLEAMERAMAELAYRREQMTESEFQEAVIDRSRELAGRPKLARLYRGTRLSEVEFAQVLVGVDAMLNDFYHIATFGDARKMPRKALNVLFRLTEHPSASLTIKVTHVKDYADAGRRAAVMAYDMLLDEKNRSKLIKRIKP